jgi:hypothetical protein
MVFCARDVSAGAELMQAELFSGDEPECPGYDVCPIAMCGCRWLGMGTPFVSDLENPDLPTHQGEG